MDRRPAPKGLQDSAEGLWLTGLSDRVPRYPALFGLKSLSADLSLRSVSRLQTE
jgi:hypothetical protein